MDNDVTLKNWDIAVYKLNKTGEEVPHTLYGDGWNGETISKAKKFESEVDGKLIKILRPKNYDIIYVDNAYINDGNKKGGNQ